MKKIFANLIPKRFRRSRVVIPVVKLNGVIAATRRGLSLDNIGGSLDKAFAKPATKAVALAINSPGGSPVQSALIHDRIRQLAAKNDIQVIYRFWSFAKMLQPLVVIGWQPPVMKFTPTHLQL